MPYRLVPLVDNHYYHIYNRGVEKREIFSEPLNYQRFLEMTTYYQHQGPKPSFSTHKRLPVQNFIKNEKIVEIICYCLMPNHFHLLVKQTKEKGISEFMAKLINSYTKHFNTKYDRIGPILQGPFKAKLIETEELLLHLSRYIHLNPLIAQLVTLLRNYPYSSYNEYLGLSSKNICLKDLIRSFFSDTSDYDTFMHDQVDYARQLAAIKHLLIEE